MKPRLARKVGDPATPCPKCGGARKCRSRHNGRRESVCRPCINEHIRELYKQDPSRWKERNRRSAIKHRQRIRDQFARWYSRNKHRVIAQASAWAKQNPSRRLEISRAYAARKYACGDNELVEAHLSLIKARSVVRKVATSNRTAFL